MKMCAALASLTLLLSCSGSPSSPPGDARPAPRPYSSEQATEHRGLTRPDEAVVDNHSRGRYRRATTRAIRDLRAISFWEDLTRELFVVSLNVRPGRRFVPQDAHLADAFRTLDIRGRHAGVLCDVTFYPTAMSDDLARWRSYYQRGLIAEPPPTERQLWAAILAHELAHCLKKGNGEKAAQGWEERALAALRRAGLR